MTTTPNSREQYSAHLPALHLLCNLGWHFLTTAQALALREPPSKPPPPPAFSTSSGARSSSNAPSAGCSAANSAT